MAQIAMVILAICSVASARMAYEFPDGAETILSKPFQNSFTCDSRTYGYYADVANNCEVFHICLPIPDETGEIADVHQFSFVCGNTTVFSQDALTCMHKEDALPCEESESFYEVSNADFGVIPEDTK